MLERNPIGQDEVCARRTQPYNSPGGLPIPDAFRVLVDGFIASELGIRIQFYIDTGSNLRNIQTSRRIVILRVS